MRLSLFPMDVNQHYLFEARQMQALSLAVHIPLVCFGIAFPVLVLFAEYRYLRTGDVLPWAALFANPMFWREYVHMYFAAFVVCGFLVGSVYACWFLGGRGGRYERTALRISVAAASVAAPLQVIVGDWAARDVATY